MSSASQKSRPGDIIGYERYWKSESFAIEAYDSCAACKASSSVLNCVVAAV
jgi:hypothetical protein